ncbi:MAG: ABC transporter ATP-binding protein [Candidatus Paceibacterota bacterium]|jgi:ATP-binding cassette subfamily B protein
METGKQQKIRRRKPSMFGLLRPYKWSIGGLVLLAVASSALGLMLPKIMSRSIDAYTDHAFILNTLIAEYGTMVVIIFILTYAQSIVQTYTSERVARDLRERLSDKISRQKYAFVEKVTPAKLLTNLTSDVDAIKTFIALAIAALVSSIIIVVGAAILLFTIDWELALAVLTIVPVIGILFYLVFSKVKALTTKSREVIDWLNKIINESILGAALIRVLDSHKPEYEKFFSANSEAKNIGLQILKIFASMVPTIGFIANLAILVILALGGRFVIDGAISLGDFTAFNSYVGLLIFPVLIIGVMSSVIAQAAASYERIYEVLEAKEDGRHGLLKKELAGDIEFKDITLAYDEKPVLKNISFKVKAHSRTAIIGPTAAGKTQLLYLLIGLVEPNSGSVEYDGHPINSYDEQLLHRQVGLVFQDSIIFNLTLRENIAFSDTVQDADLEKAIGTAEMKDFISSLPEGLDTIVSERGSSLSGGQKQRIMLARALALNPKVLLLDDFTARVDNKTEQKILDNIIRNYPDITLVSVTQKISSVEKYDQIILLMEGEIIAAGLHDELLKTCPEYVQIYNSQKSTNQYE